MGATKANQYLAFSTASSASNNRQVPHTLNSQNPKQFCCTSTPPPPSPCQLMQAVFKTLNKVSTDKLSICVRNSPEMLRRLEKSLLTKSQLQWLISCTDGKQMNKLAPIQLMITIFDSEAMFYPVSLECHEAFKTKLMGDRAVAKALFYLVHNEAPEGSSKLEIEFGV